MSFPSGHPGSAAAFVTGLALESPGAGAALAPLALGIGYSRVHYPGDVLAGLAVGGAVAASARRGWQVIAGRPRDVERFVELQ
ncbi:phosphatase PAP2 family protein [Blastococcus sp. BMG 814]|uniref:Phosphatase PAP2 family protein n=1 Tax=Blastococcus carthaginiensis TaxID=3050034 RepID=A0ABT9IDX4_9ACTN|nr:phosphatase PAP2 family protein [Blastococcus carthaginiensis]MDP5183772.1 phosphatase PAP2 family protein [Blastococcus carthaginiensis]